MKNLIISIAATGILLYLFSMYYYHSLTDRLDKDESKFYFNDYAILSEENEDGNEGTEHAAEGTAEKDDSVSDQKDNTSAELKLYAVGAVLMDASNNRVLYEKSGYKEMPMASTTKIMTCIVTLENGNLDDTVTVSKYAATMPDVQLNIREGEQYKLRDLLYSLMLESHNDSAVAIAEHIGGSVEGFARLMNQKAVSLGCNNTNFVTPNGLDKDGHMTTARDLAVISAYAIKNDEFIEITNTPAWQFNEVNDKRRFSITNKDRFLYSYSGAIGIKTGYTSKAGFCFAGAAKRDDKTFISVVLGSGWPPNKNYKWQDTKLLMDYGFNNYKYRQIFDSEKQLEPLLVVDGKAGSVDLTLNGDITLLMNETEFVNTIYEVPKILKAPIAAGETVGKADYYINDDLYASLPIKAAQGVDAIDFGFCLDKIFDLWTFSIE